MRRFILMLMLLLIPSICCAATNDEVKAGVLAAGVPVSQYVGVSQNLEPGQATVYVTPNVTALPASIKVGVEVYRITWVRTDIPKILTLMPFKTPVEVGRTDRWATIPPGVSTGHPNITAGTSSYEFEFDYVGSNAHVFSPNGWKVGDAVLQPGAYDGGQVGNDNHANLVNSRMATNWQSIKELRWDFAWAKLNGTRPYDFEILGLAKPTGHRGAIIGERARKSGRTTAVTTSYVSDLGVDINVNYGSVIIYCLGCTAYEPVFLQGGDSGSPVLGDDDKAIDIAFASSSTISFGIGDLPGLFSTVNLTLKTGGSTGHDWVKDGDYSFEVPVQGNPGQRFKLESCEYTPQEPEAGSQVTITPRFRRLTDYRWYRYRLEDRDTGQMINEGSGYLQGDVVSNPFKVTAPEVGGVWKLRLVWYFDQAEETTVVQ